MFLHEFREDFVLALELLLQEGDLRSLSSPARRGRDSKAAVAFSKNSFCQR